MAGRAHPNDTNMINAIDRICNTIDQNPILRERVHFVQNYDEELSRALAQGADIALNTPQVRNEQGERISTEASGTSGMKDALGNTLLISTEDGWFADARIRAETAGTSDFKPPYLEITGITYEEEVASLYEKMREASQIIDKGEQIEIATRQMREYLPIVSSARMIKDYLNMAIPQK
jgi:glucan phosphorylase